MNKLLIASDLHGSALYCQQLVAQIERTAPDKILLLGDLLYHGPRNDLPDGYAPKEVIALLNPLSPRLLCVRGNCDAEVDQMVLTFPLMADYALLALGDATVFATHGHHFGEEAPPPHTPGNILLCGHTHVPACVTHEDFTYLNPGSVSLPKAGSCRSYMVWQNGVFTWHRLADGDVYQVWPAESAR